jgi:L-ascorbate metabolism protein UlaG (beta-lactamase superfamily)
MSTLAITRIVNASVLIEIGGGALLTDPYFDARWFMRMREPIGMRAASLPRLSAILGGHGVLDHWQPRSLADYRWREETPLLVATPSMERKARAAGFPRCEVVAWGTRRMLDGGIAIEVAPAQTAMGMRVNSYVIEADGRRLFVGTEARDLEPLRQFRARSGPVDLAILPIDASAVAGHQLVMSAAEAIEGARILGARTLIPIHYALKSLPPLLWNRSSLDDLLARAETVSDLAITPLETGRRWIG